MKDQVTGRACVPSAVLVLGGGERCPVWRTMLDQGPPDRRTLGHRPRWAVRLMAAGDDPGIGINTRTDRYRDQALRARLDEIRARKAHVEALERLAMAARYGVGRVAGRPSPGRRESRVRPVRHRLLHGRVGPVRLPRPCGRGEGVMADRKFRLVPQAVQPEGGHPDAVAFRRGVRSRRWRRGGAPWWIGGCQYPQEAQAVEAAQRLIDASVPSC